MRLLCWCLAATMVVAGLTTSASGQAGANQAQLRWYDAYQQGVAAVRRSDWSTAEKLLLQAQKSGNKPGPRVFTYGDNYIRFLPDYYLGVVYLNTNRDREAEAAFARVRSQNLIAAKDPEYAAFERQEREARFNRAMNEAVDLLKKGDLAQANLRAEEARATKIDDVKATRLSAEIKLEMTKAQNAGANTPVQTPAQTPVQQPLPPAQPPTGTVVGGLPNTGNSNTPTKPVVVPPRVNPPASSAGNNQTFGNQGVILPRSTALRDGLLAFFSGDYLSAIPLLTAATQQPGANPRALVFLACAKAGLVLTGGGDAAMLREARTTFQSADAARNLSDADRRFISPRVLQQLETP